MLPDSGFRRIINEIARKRREAADDPMGIKRAIEDVIARREKLGWVPEDSGPIPDEIEPDPRDEISDREEHRLFRKE